MTRQQNEDVYDDDQDEEPTLNRHIQHSEAHLAAVGGDAARNGCSQSMDQSIDPLRFGSMADHSSSSEMSALVDPTDPLANRHDTADLEPTSMSPPPFPSQMPDPGKPILPLDNEDRQREIRSRSCSVATLDFPFERVDAQGINTDTHDEQRELLLGATANLVDCANHPQLFANSAVLPNEDGSILILGSLPEGSNQATIKMEEPRDVETDSLQPCRKAPTTRRGRLPRVGKRQAWNSIINFAAYETMLGPLFTQQKEMIRSVTYDDMMDERAERMAKKK